MEIVKWVKCFLEAESCGKDTQARSEAELHFWLKFAIIGIFFQVFSGQSSCSLCIAMWLRTLPDVPLHLLTKIDFSMRVSGRLAGHIIDWYPLPSLMPKESFSARVVWEVSLIPGMRNMWPPYLFYPSRTQLLSTLYLEVSVLRRQILCLLRRQSPAAQPGAHLSPASVMPL